MEQHFTRGILLIGFLLNVGFIFGQAPERVKVGSEVIETLLKKGTITPHYLDSIPGVIHRQIKDGRAAGMSEAQLNLGYFHFLLFDESLFRDTFFLRSFDELYSNIVASCEEFGFYQFVFQLGEINEYRSHYPALFQSDTTTVVFDENSEFFDYDLLKLRGKLYRLIDDFKHYKIYADRIREYLTIHIEELAY